MEDNGRLGKMDEWATKENSLVIRRSELQSCNKELCGEIAVRHGTYVSIGELPRSFSWLGDYTYVTMAELSHIQHGRKTVSCGGIAVGHDACVGVGELSRISQWFGCHSDRPATFAMRCAQKLRSRTRYVRRRERAIANFPMVWVRQRKPSHFRCRVRTSDLRSALFACAFCTYFGMGDLSRF